jgi:hypothetical protein
LTKEVNLVVGITISKPRRNKALLLTINLLKIKVYLTMEYFASKTNHHKVPFRL